MPVGSPRDVSAASAARRAKAQARTEVLRWIFERERSLSARALAEKLGPAGYYKEPTLSGRGEWSAKSVIRVRKALRLMQHPQWDARFGNGKRQRLKAEKQRSDMITKAELHARQRRGWSRQSEYEDDIAWIVEHPEPRGWPEGSVRLSQYGRTHYVMRDGSAVTLRSHKLIPSSPDVMRRRRNYSRQLWEAGRPGVYFPLTRDEAINILGPPRR